MRTFATIFLLALVGAPLPTWAQRESDTLQRHVFVSALTYDDGFGVPLAEPAGIWFDRKTREVYVADGGNGRIVIYDSLLTPLFSFKHFITDRFSKKVELGSPRSLAVNDEGEMLLLDSRSDRLDLLDYRGRLLQSAAPNRLLGDSTLRLAFSGICIDAAGRFYVLALGDVNRVLVLDRDLNLVRQFGERGNLPEQLTAPEAIGVSDGKIFVSDSRGLPAVKVFDSLGRFLSGFGGHDVKPEDLTLPQGVAFLDNPLTGPVTLVMDGLRQMVKLYNAEGELVSSVGGFGYALGLLQYPSGIASDGVAMFYVVEKVGGRVQRYDLL